MTRGLSRLSGILTLALCLAGLRAAPGAAQRANNPHPGDVIRLRVWREPEMSGDFQVDRSGQVVLPRIGPLAVSGITPDSLRAFIVAAYAPSLQNPSIEVTVLRRIRVIGAVKNPGLYPVDQTLSVADVLALAGGATPEGDRGKIRLTRAGTNKTETLASDARLDELTLASGDQIEVPERSWLSRNTALVATLASSVALIFITVVRR
jgi:polysaccharide export outer membrane protein